MPPPPRLRAVAFDLWETLIADPPGRGQERAVERVGRVEVALRAGGWPAPPQAIADAFQATVDALVVVHQDNVDLDAAGRLQLFYRHLDPTLDPDRDLPPAARDGIAEAIHGGSRYAPPQLLPGAIETLSALRQAGLRLALVSNAGFSPGVVIRELLADLGLARFFTAQVYSDETQVWKPHARMFDEAVFALGVPAAQVAFVGDRPIADILGAQQFGIGLSVLVGPRRREGVRAAIELDSIAGLVDALRERRLLPA
ncbi:MAG: FMN phosphatase YigB, HAD superfamily [Chloroflexi bacterium]|nr:MAG: FMN phosphatase YigB, HAD superfamily [Chloroflexota bacterium]